MPKYAAGDEMDRINRSQNNNIIKPPTRNVYKEKERFSKKDRISIWVTAIITAVTVIILSITN